MTLGLIFVQHRLHLEVEGTVEGAQTVLDVLMDGGFADAEALGGSPYRRLVLDDVKGQPAGPLLDVPFHTRNTPHRGFHCGMYMRRERGTERACLRPQQRGQTPGHGRGVNGDAGEVLQGKDGLVEEHAQAVEGGVAQFSGTGQEGGLQGGVDEVAYRHTGGQGLQEGEVIKLALGSRHAQGGAVHQQVGAGGLGLEGVHVKAGGGENFGRFAAEGLGLLYGPVADGHRGCPLLGQLQGHRLGGAARPQQDHPAASGIKPGVQQGLEKPTPIRVVSIYFIVFYTNRIYRAVESGVLVQLIHEGEKVLLVGHGGVEAGVAGESGALQPPGGLPGPDGLTEVDIIQPQRLDHGVLDQGGLGVEHRVSDDAQLFRGVVQLDLHGGSPLVLHNLGGWCGKFSGDNYLYRLI